MALFRRRTRPDVSEIVEKAVQSYISQAASNSSGGVTATPGGATYPVPSPSSPFSQTGGGIIEQPLPRPDASFNSLFGPGYPLTPDPLDPVGRNGRVPPRRSEYLVAWNLQLVDRQVPWTMLRWLAEDCDLVNRCIQLTQDEQCGLDWAWTFSPRLLQQIMADTGETNTAKAAQIARGEYGVDLLRVQQFFDHPDRDMNQSFPDWLQALLWDHLVYDGVAIYPRVNLDGSLRNLELIDASTIKLYRDNLGRIPQPPGPAYAQILYGFPRGEFQHTPGEADDEFALDQLAYYIRRPRNTSVYGYPQVEEVMALATTYLGRQAWMRGEYTTGVTPKMIVNVDDNGAWTPEQWAMYEQTFNDRLSGQIERRQMAFFLREGAKAVWAPQIDEHYKSDYDNWLISQIAARFGRPPTMLGVQAKAGLSGGKQMEGEADQSDIYSGKALSLWLVRVLNDLAVRYLGVPPGVITATFDGGGTQEDELQEAQADVALVGAGIVTRNEARTKRNMPLLPEPEADQLAITTSAGVTFLAGQLKAQEEAMEAAAAAPVGDGGTAAAPGAPATSPAAKPPAPPVAPPAAKAVEAKTAGLVVKADDTGRVLMVQRSIDNQNQRAAGLWEWPGGRLDGGETALEAAQREWAQETGLELPDGKLAGQFDYKDGAYVAFVWVVKHESDLDLSGADRPDVSEVENVAWWDPSDIVGNSAVRVEVQSSDWAMIGSAKKAAGGPPKALADRKAVEAAIVAHYGPVLAAGYRKAFPGIVQAARDAVAGHRNHAGKAAADAEGADAVAKRFRASRKADTAALAAVLKALHTDAWVAGTKAAVKGPGGGAIAASIDDVSVDAPDDWAPGWAEDHDVTSPPAGLARLAADAVAGKLAAGLLDRVCKVIADGVAGGGSVSAIGQAVRAEVGDENWPELAAVSETARAAESAVQASYQSAGIDRWRWVGIGECDVCTELHGQVFGAGDDPPPAHPRCDCGSEPVTGSE